jgi:histidine triad (HIT) family protein
LVAECLFCKIVEGSVPARVVAETERLLAFDDISPVAPTHVLIIPKEHAADSAAEITAEHASLLAEIFELAARIADERGLDDGWRVVTNVGPAAGQTIFHLHFHLMGGWARSHR